MDVVTKAKLFTHGGSQAVRLPKAFRFTGEEVRISKDGARVILEPVEPDWAAFWAQIDANKTGDAQDEWPDIEQPPPARDVPDFDW